MREDRIDVIVGVNLLREGIDLPEVSLVAIIDADKEGFLRNVRAITQIAGRAARHTNGQVNLYGDRLTGTLRTSLIESNRRRAKQIAYNLEHGVLPRRAKKSGTGSALLSERTPAEDTTLTTLRNAADIATTLRNADIASTLYNAPDTAVNAPNRVSNSVAEPTKDYTATPTANALQGTLETLIEESRKAMEEAAKSLDFVSAAKHRDRMRELQKLATDSK
jgi:excinuclease ABC subunit B